MTLPTQTPSEPTATPNADAAAPDDAVVGSTHASQSELDADSPNPESEDDDGGWIRRGPREAAFDYDRRWLEQVYQPDVPQLTARAVLTGGAIGAVLAISNLYVGLKAGWALGVAITALVISTAVWRSATRIGLAKRGMGILEQNCMQSTASAAGFTTSAVLVTAVPAYMLVTDIRIEPFWLVVWSFSISILGLSLSIPVKRQLLHYERLAWPSSVAAAQTLQALHETGARAARQARWLFSSAALSTAIRWAIDNSFSWWRLPAWPQTLEMPGRLGAYGIGVDASTLYFAAGALLGPRVSAWMLVGSASVWLGFAPWMVASGRLDEPAYGSVMLSGALWAGAAMMVTSGLTSLALQWRLLARGVSGLRHLRRSNAAPGADPIADIEIPMSWAWAGSVASSIVILIVGQKVLGIAWPLSLFGILIAAAVAAVAIRATGETDITPAGSLGKLTQLGFGIAAPQALAANLLGTSIVTSSAAAASDTAVNLKCGHLLGAHPRKQFLAQAFGVLIGVMVVVPAFALLVPNASVLGSESLPAPAAQAWRVVAELMGQGIDALSVEAKFALVAGGILGVLFSLGDLRSGERSIWWPSPIGLGMGMVIGFSESTAFFLGAMLALWIGHRRPKDGDDLVVATSAGLIAGDSLMGVFLALLVALGWMVA